MESNTTQATTNNPKTVVNNSQTTVNNSQSSVKTTPVDELKFKNFIKRITGALNFSTTDANNLANDLFKKFGDVDKYKLLTNTDINNLLEADKSVKELEKKMQPYYSDISANWTSLLNNLGRLQALILIKKLEEPVPNCGEIVKDIVNALNNKISTVNNILEANIKVSEKADKNKQKYLKYKSKYLHLKNNM